MRHRALFLCLSAIAIVSIAKTQSASFLHLNPGGLSNLPETVPVNIVFVGYDAPLVNQASFLAALPGTYRPIVRSRYLYGIKEELGLSYTFQYQVTFTNAAWENSFFAALSSLATPQPRTLFQDQYNEQIHNVLDVATNHFIDAPSVEKWLIDNAPAGVDTHRNTIFFINWWGRQDFKFHVYTKFGEPDPDTGYDFGVNRQSRKIIAWGGTAPDDEETLGHAADLGIIPIIVADACGAGHAEAAERSIESLKFAGDAIITDSDAFCRALQRKPG